MKKIFYSIVALASCVLLTQCKGDFLSVSSPDKSDDVFVTSSVSETFKTLAYCYGSFRSIAGGGNYNWNDPCSDVEYYPEYNSGNGRGGFSRPTEMSIDARKSQFNDLYKVLARCARIAGIIEQKEEFINAKGTNDWTQLYGEAWTMWAYSYFLLVKHFGDIPFGIENAVVEEYDITSRYVILDELIAKLKTVEGGMYDLGENGITGERMNRTFANYVIALCNLYAGGYQTLRTDVSGLYGNLSFDNMYKDAGAKAEFSRRADWQNYYKEAQTYLRKVIGERKGTAKFITSDDRSYADNPFQRNFQYIMDMQVSPESLWEVGNIAPNQSERPYSQGRPSDGGNSNAAPCKVFSGVRVMPTFYYSGYEAGDKRRDASAVVTGSNGKGTEALVNLKSGSRLSGGIAINKWDINKMAVPYVAAPRKSGMNYQMARISVAMLELAEVDAALGENAEALSLLNQIRSRAFGDDKHALSNLSGEALTLAVINEFKRETLGEGDTKFAEIREGLFTKLVHEMRAELKTVIDGLEADGYYTFSNGNTISTYVWTKLVDISGKQVPALTYDAKEGETNPALTPGWRGIFDYTTTSVASAVSGTEHNLAIVGLFDKVADPAALEADGYTKTEWAKGMVDQRNQLWDTNMISGIEISDVPYYIYPLPLETIQQSKGKVTNGYGLPQQ